MSLPVHNGFWLGVDLSSQWFDAAIAPQGAAPEDWRKLDVERFERAPHCAEGVRALAAWIERRAPGQTCLGVAVESTGKLSRRFAKACRETGLPEVVILNPRRVKAYGQSLGVRDKNDAIDAAILAVFALTHRLRPSRPLSPAEEKLQELTRLRQSYSAQRNAARCRRSELDHPSGRALLDKTLKHLSSQIRQLDAEIAQTIQADAALSDQVKSLCTIFGIKKVIASTLTAELGRLDRFTKRACLSAAAGVFPKRFCSGSSVNRKSRMAKGGGSRVRRVLYLAALCAYRYDGPLRRYAQRLAARGMEKMCILGALMRKILLIARAVVINGGHYDPKKVCFQGG